MKEPNSILIEQQPINNLYSNDTIVRLGSMDRFIEKDEWNNIQLEQKATVMFITYFL